jgi:broad specificity phosphatase PhoE
VRSSAALVALSLVVLAAVAGAASSPSAPVPGAKGLILLVRHAERVQSGPGDDPALTEAGRARAQRLADMLAKSGVRTVFITRFRRTKDTAQPLADALQLAPIVESDTVQLIAKLRTHLDETVLVVGHSDTVPDVIQAFGGPSVTIADDAFDDLFVLSPATGALTRLKY